MRKVGGTPIGEKITSVKSLAPCQQRRVKRLRDILRKEGILSREVSVWEKRYLLKREWERQRRRRRQEEGRAMARWELKIRQAREKSSLAGSSQIEVTPREAPKKSLEEILKMLAQGEPEKPS